MRSLFAALSLALYAIPTLSAAIPTPNRIKRSSASQINSNSYIVKLKDGFSFENVSSIVKQPGSSVTHKYDPSSYNGFAGVFSESTLNKLKASNYTDYIVEDDIMSTSTVETGATWSLDRINSNVKLADQNPLDLSFTYSYESKAGSGVDVYIIDTGIYTEHPDFQGRARWGTTVGGYLDADGNGHGTHVAGSVGSLHYGVAKAVNLIAVKVLADDGTGTVSDIISGLQWVQAQVQASGRPSVATMSLGGSYSLPLIEATGTVSIIAGIHIVVAAGNSNEDSSLTSPGDTPMVITVGASDITDSRAYYSNYGTFVDLFAPGSNITSTWNDGGSYVMSGTSMATPHVAGVVAYFISINGNMKPSDMSSYVTSHALKNQLSNIPRGTANLLVHFDYVAGT